MCAKVRNYFVSNSSSSSFVIYGAGFDTTEIKEFAKKILNLTDVNKYEATEKLAEHLGIGFETDPENGTCYLGAHPMSIGDDETGKQFRDRIQNALKTLNPDVECECHEVEYNC